MAVQAALVLLCCRSRWDALRASFRDVLSARVRETHSGLCKLNKLASVKLARLCIMFVPHNMMSHWHKTAMSAIFGAKETYGQALDVLLWKGKHRDHSMKNAYDSGKPVLWILALESESMEAVTRTPEIAYAARIEDELSSKMGTRYDKPQSVPLYSYIVSLHCPVVSCANSHMSLSADPSHHRDARELLLRRPAPPAPPGHGRQLQVHARRQD